MPHPSYKFESRDQFFKFVLKNIETEIMELSKDEILNLDDFEYLNYIFNKYYINPITVDKDKEEIKTPKKIKREIKSSPYSGLYGRHHEYFIQDGYEINVEYPFTGDYRLFFVRPNSFTIGGIMPELNIDENKKILTLSYKCWNMDSEQFNENKSRGFENIITHYLTINSDVEKFNNTIKDKAQKIIKERRDECIRENSFFKAINVKPRSNVEASIVMPILKRPIPQKPQIKNKSHNYYPTMAMEMYESIIDSINQMGQAWEKLPSIYRNKDEEALRDLFLSYLITEYRGITSTGETFNCGGKTDICVKDPDSNQNLFIAECKIWKGSVMFHKAINQLFDNYLTVRDSKAALIFFVNNNEFNSVLDTIKKEVSKHLYFQSNNGGHGPSSFSYIFKLPSDKEQKVNLEIMVFHFPKREKKQPYIYQNDKN